MKKTFLQPGEIKFSKTPTLITTILGSCVSVCIHDKKLKIGGICHYYLPFIMDRKKDNPNKYGQFAITKLLKKFKDNGSNLKDLTAKIIGGGYVSDIGDLNGKNIGKENIMLAINKLSDFKIKIIAKSVGGFFGKKVRFNTQTGETKLIKIEKYQGTVYEQELSFKIKVLIVDDSVSIRKILRNMIERDSSFQIINEASNPIEAKKIIRDERPDVITLDIKMPIMDGVTFLGQYMKSDPIPTLMISSLNYNDYGPVFEAMELGAFDYIKKPSMNEVDSIAIDLHEKLKSAYNARNKIKKVKQSIEKEVVIVPDFKLKHYLVAMGASTGGTEALKEILIRLPKNIPPIIIVQHIPPVFSKAFANRLNDLCDFEVKEAEDGDEICAGRAIIAKGGKHMKVETKNSKLIIRISDDPPVNRFIPSVDYLFDSVSKIRNKKIVGVLLTGMGEDGANGLLKLKNSGAMTIGQDEASSAVYGMPKAAFEKDAVLKVANLFNIPNLISNFVNK